MGNSFLLFSVYYTKRYFGEVFTNLSFATRKCSRFGHDHTDNKVMDGSSDLIYHTGINCDYFAGTNFIVFIVRAFNRKNCSTPLSAHIFTMRLCGSTVFLICQNRPQLRQGLIKRRVPSIIFIYGFKI